MGEWFLSRWDGAIFLTTPGTSWVATIMPSLWDKYILRAEALIKLALMGSPLGTPILHRLGKDYLATLPISSFSLKLSPIFP